MKRVNLKLSVMAVSALSIMSFSAHANTLKWAAAGDSLTLDPHAQNEGPTHTLAHQMYCLLYTSDAADE